MKSNIQSFLYYDPQEVEITLNDVHMLDIHIDLGIPIMIVLSIF